MKVGVEEMKRAFMVEVGTLFDQMISSMVEGEPPTLAQIEEEVLAFRKKVGVCAAEAIVGAQESVRPVRGPLCQKCHQEMRYKWS